MSYAHNTAGNPHFHNTEATRSVDENVPANTRIGSRFTAHSLTPTYRYVLRGRDADSFIINQNNGQLKTKDPLDYETQSSYTVRVVIQSGFFTSYTNRDSIVVTINVNDIDEWMPDENLTAAVRDALDLGNSDVLTKAAMADLTALRATQRQISDLTGLEHATNLESLIIWTNDISDLSPIADLTSLEILRMGHNDDPDISVLSGLTNLVSLGVNECSIDDISVLANFEKLEVLTLNDNNITDISVLSDLENLQSLRLINNSVSDVSPLADLENLTELKLAGNPITNTGPLADVVSALTVPLDIVVIHNSKLEELARSTLISQGDLAADQVITPQIMKQLTTLSGPWYYSSSFPVVRKLDGLEYATNLEKLLLTNLKVNLSLEPLDGLQHLSHLDFDGRIKDLEILSTLPSLTHLDIKNGGITDATPIGELTDLEELDLSFNKLMDLSPLSNLVNLKVLKLGYNTSAPFNANVSNALDISPLADLTGLEVLHLYGNAISDISALEHLTNLRTLTLYRNEIVDISALENLTNLESLFLFRNNISDISVLSGLTNLEDLRLSSNDISDVSPLRGLRNLTKLTLKNNPIENAFWLYPLTQQDPAVDIDIDVPLPIADVPDANLAAVLRSALGLASDADILKTELIELTALRAIGEDITDLTGLEYATNLTGLILNENTSLSDLTPISGLVGLTSLDIETANLNDITPLANLTALTYLNLKGNSITDISVLGGLVNLTDLRIQGNGIVDVHPLSNLIALRQLNLAQNLIEDVSPLVSLTGLSTLMLADNPISEPSVLYPLTQQDPAVDIDIDVSLPVVDVPDTNLAAALRTLLSLASDEDITELMMKELTSLQANSVSDLTGLEHATNLTTLTVTHGNIIDISPLSSLVNLTTLNLSGNDIVDIPALSTLTNLAALDLADNGIADISALSSLTNLAGLQLDNNEIVDISALSGLVDLFLLNLSDNEIVDISALSSLVNFQWLYLQNNNIVDVSALNNSNLTSLTILDLSGNEIVDISMLGSLASLTIFDLSDNEIVDISVLSNLAALQQLDLKNNNIVDVSSLVSLTGLKNLMLAGNSISEPSVLYPLTQQDPAVNIDIDVPEPVINVPDTALAGAIRTLLGLASDADITYSKMKELTSLRANSVSDLTGLEHATNLTNLTLSHSDIVDISALSTLVNLTTLDLQSNEIVDISALSSLTNLLTLDLSDNEIVDISALSGLVDLAGLQLDNNEIVDISALSGLVDLFLLNLADNEIADISALSSLINFQWLYLQNNNIVDVSALNNSNLTSLTTLDLSGNEIVDISMLGSLASLTIFDLSDNEIVDISVLSNLASLQQLDLKNNDIVDVSSLVSLTGLKNLMLARNPISDASVLYPLTQRDPAVNIDIDVLPVTVEITLPAGLISGAFDITITFSEAVSDFIQGDVSLSGNNISGTITSWSTDDDIVYAATILPTVDTSVSTASIVISIPAAVATDSGGIPNRASPSRSLRVVGGTPISIPDTNLAAAIREIRNLAEGQAITTGVIGFFSDLNLDNRQISDLTGLEQATSLKQLSLNDNNISDISPLSGLTALQTLRLNTNSITDVSGLSGLSALRILDLQANTITDISGLSGLSALRTLDLRSNTITDVSPLVNMTHLSTLFLEGNSITNVGLLYPLTQQTSPVRIDIDVPFTGPTVTNIAWPNYLAAPYLSLYPDESILGLQIDQDPFEVTITFSEDVTDFVASDIELRGDATAAVTSLTGSGSVYTAKISVTHSGDGAGDGLLAIVIPNGAAQDTDGINNAAYSTEDQKTVRVVFYPNLEIDAPEGEQSGSFNVKFEFSEPVTDFEAGDIQTDTSLFSFTLSENDDGDEYTLAVTPNNSAYGNTINFRVTAHAVKNAEGAANVKSVTADIEMIPYAPWDINEDGYVDATDTALVTAALGQSGTGIIDPRTDVDADGDVDNDDLLLVTGNLDDAGGAAPLTPSEISNLLDVDTFESLDRDVLQAQLQILRAESDGSLKYQNAIALLEAFLAATRPDETILLANYPNPFNPETWIPYHLANGSDVRITIYDTRGVVVHRLDLGHQREGYYTSRSRAAYWDGRNNVGERVASGIYFYQLEADDISLLRKMVILK